MRTPVQRAKPKNQNLPEKRKSAEVCSARMPPAGRPRDMEISSERRLSSRSLHLPRSGSSFNEKMLCLGSRSTASRRLESIVRGPRWIRPVRLKIVARDDHPFVVPATCRTSRGSIEASARSGADPMIRLRAVQQQIAVQRDLAGLEPTSTGSPNFSAPTTVWFSTLASSSSLRA